MAFLRDNSSDVQDNLKHSIKSSMQNDTGEQNVSGPFVNFVTRFHQKHNVQAWSEIPGDCVNEAMHSSFFEQCANPVLMELGRSSSTTIIPSSVLNEVDDEFYRVLNMYNAFLTRAPLSLTKLCRMILGRQGPSHLIRLFQKVTEPKLREYLFHIIDPE